MTHSSIFFDRTSPALLNANMEEVFRYMGFAQKDRKNPEPIVADIAEKVVNDFKNLIVPQAVYVSYPLQILDGQISFDNHIVQSKELSRFLRECSSIFLFAATLGPKVDREIQKAQKIEPSKAVIMQAAGAMYIEEYCDLLCEKFNSMAKEENCTTKHRFSPGFGDVSLENQKLFFRILDCKKIGLTLMDTLIMAPEKSVTAFVGVKKIDEEKDISKDYNF